MEAPIAVLDVRGLSCPEPVFRARSALIRGKGAALDALTDSAASRDNLLRLAGREGRKAEVRDQADGSWMVRFSKAARG